MILIENTEVHGWEAAIRGMRNPMNSWDKSDSGTCAEKLESCENYTICDMGYCVGDNDLNLMKKLVKAGTDHSKFMRMINVSCDITAPMYWVAEHDTYKVGTVRNSCSFMHKGLSKPFEIKDFSVQDERVYFLLEPLKEGEYDKSQLYKKYHNWVITHRAYEDISQKYDLDLKQETYENEDLFLLAHHWEQIIDILNILRNKCIETNDDSIFKIIRQLLPQGYNIKYTWQANYQVLRNIYHSRKNHRLDEWRDFCSWINELPYSELITGCVNN